MKEYKGIYFDHKFIFIHVPKVAGKSIHHSIMGKIGIEYANKKGGNLGGHIPAVFYEDNFSLEFKSFFKFAFVRNPWDRICSAFHYIHSAPRVASHRGPRDHPGAYEDVAARFSKEEFSSFIKEGLIHYWILPHFRPQTYWILNDEGESSLDFTGKYESLTSDFDSVCKKIGVGKCELTYVGAGDSRTNGKLPYQEYYDQEMIDIVAKFYKSDIDLFDYDFE